MRTLDELMHAADQHYHGLVMSTVAVTPQELTTLCQEVLAARRMLEAAQCLRRQYEVCGDWETDRRVLMGSVDQYLKTNRLRRKK